MTTETLTPSLVYVRCDGQKAEIVLHREGQTITEPLSDRQLLNLAADALDAHRKLVVPQPINMVLTCPNCGHQHIDAPDPDNGWDNPPHRSHLCADCGIIWRPADVPTYGVEEIKTWGKADTWPPAF